MTAFSYQLYSSRKFGPWSKTLSMLKEAGYEQVEGFGALYPDLDAAKAIAADLSASGLRMTSGHIGIDNLESDPEGSVAIGKTLGMEAMLVPFLMPDQRPTDDAGWTAFGHRLEAAGKAVTDAGMEFGYHNHAFEFEPTSSGAIPMQLILDAAPSMKWENDVAWIVRGNADPLEWIERYGDRMISVHLKDIAPDGECVDEDGWADVGHGKMDWPALYKAAAATPAKYFIMEHDNPSDEVRFATRSIASAKSY